MKQVDGIKHPSHLDKPVFLVVRAGSYSDRNPVAELEICLANSHTAWFAKFGRPISGTTVTKLFSYRETYLVIAPPKRIRQPVGVYRLLSIKTNLEPPTKGNYPTYYRKHLPHIGSWLRIQRTKFTIGGLQDLKVASSLSPLLQVINVSQRGHFLCTLI